MKVTRNTPDQMIIANVPWILGIALAVFILIFVGVGLSIVASGDMMGLIFVLIGGGVGAICFVAMVRRTQVIIDRTQNRITMRTKTVFGYKEDHRPMDGLVRAELETSRGDNSDVYRPVLIFERRGATTPLPLVKVFSNSGAHARVVEDINAWLDAAEVDSRAEAP